MVHAAFQTVDGLAPVGIIQHHVFQFRFLGGQGQAQYSGRTKDEDGGPEDSEEGAGHLRRWETIRSHAHHTNVCI